MRRDRDSSGLLWSMALPKDWNSQVENCLKKTSRNYQLCVCVSHCQWCACLSLVRLNQIKHCLTAETHWVRLITMQSNMFVSEHGSGSKWTSNVFLQVHFGLFYRQLLGWVAPEMLLKLISVTGVELEYWFFKSSWHNKYVSSPFVFRI